MSPLPWLEEPLEKQVQMLRQDVADLEDQVEELRKRLPRNRWIDVLDGHIHRSGLGHIHSLAKILIEDRVQLGVLSSRGRDSTLDGLGLYAGFTETWDTKSFVSSNNVGWAVSYLTSADSGNDAGIETKL